jgi:hypothetical protein
MKILFLDFDGVLNSKQHLLAVKDRKIKGADNLNDANLFYMKRDVNYNNMWALNYLLKEVPDLKIVISSAWRLHYDISEFKDLFKIFKLPSARIIGKTDKKMSSERYHEIKWWLEDHKDVEQWIAVDDHPIFFLGTDEFKNQYLTDPWVGLTMPDVFKIIKHFNPAYEAPVLMI